jgi:hypothetical protein
LTKVKPPRKGKAQTLTIVKQNEKMTVALKGEEKKNDKRKMIRKKRKKFFTFDQSKLSEMIAVIGRVKDVGIFQLAESHQFAKDFLDSFVDALQRLVRILRSRVLGAVRRRETHHQMERLVVVVLLRLAEETNRIVRDQIRVIIRLVVGAVFNLSRSALLKTLSLLKKRKKVPDSLSPRKERKRKKNVNFNKIPVDVGLNGSRRRRAKKRKRGRKIFSYLLSVEVDGVVVVS